MRIHQKQVGAEVLDQVEAQIREWGFDTSNHDARPQYLPGDLRISNGNSRALCAEVKGAKWSVMNRNASGEERRKKTLGRPLLTAARHDWLVENRGIYILGIYDFRGDRIEIVDDLRWRRARYVQPHAGTRGNWVVSWRDWSHWQLLGPSVMHWLVDNAPTIEVPRDA